MFKQLFLSVLILSANESQANNSSVTSEQAPKSLKRTASTMEETQHSPPSPIPSCSLMSPKIGQLTMEINDFCIGSPEPGNRKKLRITPISPKSKSMGRKRSFEETDSSMSSHGQDLWETCSPDNSPPYSPLMSPPMPFLKQAETMEMPFKPNYEEPVFDENEESELVNANFENVMQSSHLFPGLPAPKLLNEDIIEDTPKGAVADKQFFGPDTKKRKISLGSTPNKVITDPIKMITSEPDKYVKKYEKKGPKQTWKGKQNKPEKPVPVKSLKLEVPKSLQTIAQILNINLNLGTEAEGDFDNLEDANKFELHDMMLRIIKGTPEKHLETLKSKPIEGVPLDLLKKGKIESRRISGKHRCVYMYDSGILTIYRCFGHYDDN